MVLLAPAHKSVPPWVPCLAPECTCGRSDDAPTCTFARHGWNVTQLHTYNDLTLF